MKIIQLKAENFKKLSAVEIAPDGNVVIISGKNEAGKSCVLDAIEAALCGGRSLPREPIKTGEHRAKVVVDMGDYKVTRKFLGTNSSIVVETTGDDGSTAKITSPQSFLDNVVGKISFDPLAFMRKTPSEQRATLLGFLGLDLVEFDTKIMRLKAERSKVRAEKGNNLALADSITLTPNLSAEEISSADLMAELSAINAVNIQARKIESDLMVLKEKHTGINRVIANAEAEIKKWQLALDAAISEELTIRNLLDQDVPAIQDTAKVEESLRLLENTNAAIRKNVKKRGHEAKADELSETFTLLGEQLRITEDAKAKKMAEQTMPIEGLTVLPDGLAFEGIPLEQVNTASHIKICVAIAMALNPRLKVLRISGNDLDEDNLKAIAEMAKEKDYQIWIEKVGDDKSVGFFIEDGALVGGSISEKDTV